MITRFWLGTRREGLSREEFSDHWRGVHAAFGRAIPGLRAYVQNHLVEDPAPGQQPPVAQPWFDGCSELDFDDVAAMTSAFASPELVAADRDELAFADPDRFGVVVTVRHPVVGDAAGDTSARLLLFVTDVAPEDRDAARERSRELVATGALGSGAARGELLVAVDDAPQVQAADHVQSLWFTSVDALHAAGPRWVAECEDALGSLSGARWVALVRPVRIR